MEKEMQMEIQSLNSEKRMYELANKGYQNMIAEQLRGSMGEDIKNTILTSESKKKNGLWYGFLYKLDNFLRMVK